MTQQQEQQRLFEVTLVKPHTHAGKQFEAGAKLKVNEPTRAWMAANKIINALGAQGGDK